MVSGGLGAVRDAYREPKADLADAEQRWQTPHATDEDVLWAASRIGSTGRLHDNELALINFLKSLQAHMHPRLLPVLDRAAA
jgi:hypothetical protein